MVALREQRLQDLQQRFLELEETERQHGQGNVENEPSSKEREEARKEAEEKTQDAIRALESAEDAGGGEALGETRRLLGASCAKSELVHTRLWQAWPKVVRRMDALQS